jgi:hypothetical protein
MSGRKHAATPDCRLFIGGKYHSQTDEPSREAMVAQDVRISAKNARQKEDGKREIATRRRALEHFYNWWRYPAFAKKLVQC